ncbi:uncharacterized protein J3R85_009216 [Psidium guajava]|nr:uncharacterized protein J3R85_009216 [Psidium guajava]
MVVQVQVSAGRHCMAKSQGPYQFALVFAWHAMSYLSRGTVQITSRMAVFNDGIEASVFSRLKAGKTLILRSRDWQGSIFFSASHDEVRKKDSHSFRVLKGFDRAFGGRGRGVDVETIELNMDHVESYNCIYGLKLQAPKEWLSHT